MYACLKFEVWLFSMGYFKKTFAILFFLTFVILSLLHTAKKKVSFSLLLVTKSLLEKTSSLLSQHTQLEVSLHVF